ncbi:hypothetical protein OGAPHI_002562 [Ogataea philodendri]|uniref:Uncharacterized protein n=1 Tax=Ogataea philodendri TaxID=1378263 RepID=A0A9P8PB87_9ASCO|nr:uncharacterized protein OGAPHI_002562 [Ogataea philodendri]KAH3668807.1 hypothetical protein OGAPHI_002562 [Ogataea philodendri]
MNFKVLKLKLNITNLGYLDETYGFEIDKVLQDCINGHSARVLENYLAGKLDVAEQPKDSLSPSVEAISRLAYMLLAVELAQLRKNLKQVDGTLKQQELVNARLKARIQDLRESQAQQLQLAQKKTQDLKQRHQERLNRIRLATQEVQNEKLAKILRLIDQSKAKHFEQLVHVAGYETVNWTQKSDASKSKLGSLERLNYNLMHMLVKQQEKAEFKNILFFSPVLPLTRYLHYKFDTVMDSVLKVALFTTLASKYLDVVLPYTVSRTEAFEHTIGNALDRSPLWIPKPDEKSEPVSSLVEVSSQDLTSFCGGLAKLIVNLVVIINHTRASRLTFQNLLAIDELVKIIVGEIATTKESAPISMVAETAPKRKSYFSMFNFWTRRKTRPPTIDEHYEKPAAEHDSNAVLEVSLFNSQNLVEHVHDQKIDIHSKIANSTLGVSPSASSSTVGASIFGSSSSMNPSNAQEWTSDEGSIPDVEWLSGKLYSYFGSEIAKSLDKETRTSVPASSELSVSTPSTYRQINYNTQNTESLGSKFKTAPLFSTNTMPIYQSNIPSTSRSRFRHYQPSRPAKTTDNWEVI